MDGYAVIDGREIVFEYNGCHFHGCPCNPNRTNKQMQKHQEWIKRKAHLEAKGCKVISTSDCEWGPLRRKLRKMKSPPKTIMSRILMTDTQECLQMCILISFFNI